MQEPRVLRFVPLPQPRPWGGRRLATDLHRHLPDDGLTYGESWDIVDRLDQQSRLLHPWRGAETLHELWTFHREEVFGSACLGHPAERFPLLCKILDTNDRLSIQVHPRVTDPVRQAAPKEECWWVIQAGPRAQLLAGTKPGISHCDLRKATIEQTLPELLVSHHPSSGDFIQVPSGTLHAIGPDLVIAEIQQNSDSTFRLHDWGRCDASGKPRELHLDQGLAAADPNLRPLLLPQADQRDGMVLGAEHYQIDHRRGRHMLGCHGEMLLILVLSAGMDLAAQRLSRGEFALIPACLSDSCRQVNTGQWLEIRLPGARRLARRR